MLKDNKCFESLLSLYKQFIRLAEVKKKFATFECQKTSIIPKNEVIFVQIFTGIKV